MARGSRASMPATVDQAESSRGASKRVRKRKSEGAVAPPPPPPAEEEVYTIRVLRDFRCDDGVDLWLVEWKGYPLDEATWEPRENFVEPQKEILEQMRTLKAAFEAGKDPKEAARKYVELADKQGDGAADDEDDEDRKAELPQGDTGGGGGGRGGAAGSGAAGSTPQRKRAPPADSGPATRGKTSDPPTAAAGSGGAATSSRTAAVSPSEGKSPKRRRVGGKERSGAEPAATSAATVDADLSPPSPIGVPTRVRSLKPGGRSSSGDPVAVLEFGNGAEKNVAVDHVRREYPQLLIDFLLSRVQFRKRDEDPNAAAAASANRYSSAAM